MVEAPLHIRNLRGLHRAFLSAFLIVISVGYLAGTFFVIHTSHGTPAGTMGQFRGNENVPIEDTDVIKFAKSDIEMLNIIHAHVTSFALIFFAIGGIFLFTSYTTALKAFLAIEPFVATLVLFGGMAALRYMPDVWAFPLATLMMLAGLSTSLCVVCLVLLSLLDMWRPGARRSF